MENRVIGADANPYVALAATLACGYLGMVNAIAPLPETTGNAYTNPHARPLPQSLSESVRLLDEVPEIEAILGKRFCGIYKAVKMSEYAEFMKVISPWEREHLLLHV